MTPPSNDFAESCFFFGENRHWVGGMRRLQHLSLGNGSAKSKHEQQCSWNRLYRHARCCYMIRGFKVFGCILRNQTPKTAPSISAGNAVVLARLVLREVVLLPGNNKLQYIPYNVTQLRLKVRGPTRCPVLRRAKLLRTHCALSGTKICYASMRSLRAVRYAATRVLCDLRYCAMRSPVLCYAPAMRSPVLRCVCARRSPVLTSRMLLPGRCERGH
eukprot:672299-Rhodomonas_salina.3